MLFSRLFECSCSPCLCMRSCLIQVYICSCAWMQLCLDIKDFQQTSSATVTEIRSSPQDPLFLVVSVLPCAIDPGSGVREAGPPSQDAVQCSMSYHVLSTPPADFAAHVPLKCLLTDFPVYSCWGSVAMVKHRSWSTKQRSACRPGKKERERSSKPRRRQQPNVRLVRQQLW